MTKTRNKKAKGKTITDLDELILTVDGEPVWRGRESLAGIPIVPRDKSGQPTEEPPEQEKLTRRRAILLALATEPKAEAHDADAKLQAGHLQIAFWDAENVKVCAEEITFIKVRLNHRWNGPIYTIMDDFLEGISEDTQKE